MVSVEEKSILNYHKLIQDKIKPKKYPWRYINDPYKILVSEFMLQRTQANQVVPIFEMFIEKYPTIEQFTHEQKKTIFEQLKTLGLYWRINNLINAVHELFHLYGKIPVDFELLKQVNGVGSYIAGAVVCFSYDTPMVLIDTNTVRVIGRVFGLDLSGEARKRKDTRKTIEIVTPKAKSRDYYYSVIDISHEYCLISRPNCKNCCLISICSFSKRK